MWQMLQNFQKKRKRKKKHAYVGKPTERAELSNFCSALKCCRYCRVLKNFENVAEALL